jgi:hypothetical protein
LIDTHDASETNVIIKLFSNNLIEECALIRISDGHMTAGVKLTSITLSPKALPCVFDTQEKPSSPPPSPTKIMGLSPTAFYSVVAVIVLVAVVALVAGVFVAYRRIKQRRSTHPYEGYEKPSANDDYYDGWS